MSPSARDLTKLLAPLRTPEAAGRLVDRWVADLLSRSASELLPPAKVAESVRRFVLAATSSDAFHARVVFGITDELKQSEAEPGTVGDGVPPDLTALARTLTRRPYSPQRAVVLAVLDREPVRKLIRALLVDVLTEFGRRLASLASPLTGSRVGRGLGALGAIAGAVGGGVVGAVSGELERQVEKRVADFADLGISRVLQRLADLACDPSLAQDQSELRGALLEGLLEVRVADMARDARKQDPEAIASLVRQALQTYAAQPQLQQDVEAYVTRILSPELAQPLGEVLTKLGLRAEVDAILRETLLPRATSFDWAGWVESELRG